MKKRKRKFIFQNREIFSEECIKDVPLNGSGIFYYQNGDKYEGQINNGFKKGEQFFIIQMVGLMKENQVKMLIKVMESQKIIGEIDKKDIEQTEHSKNKEFNHIQMAVFMMENEAKAKETVIGSLNTKMETDKKENELIRSQIRKWDISILKY